jgi:hypothetical protein
MNLIKNLIRVVFGETKTLGAPNRSVLRSDRPWDRQLRVSTHFTR